MSSKKYLFWFTLITFIILSAICTFNYIVDPFMQYRVKDGKYILNPRLVNPGLLKNYDYNLLLIGSSMVQVIDMDMLREKTSSNPLKAASGDMNVKELELIYSLAKKEEVNTFIINLDLHKFFIDFEDNRYPEYLYKKNILSPIQYWLSYETNRFSPIDIVVSNYVERNNEVSPKLYNKIAIDKIGDFGDELTYSIDLVKKDFCNRQRPDKKVIYDKMTQRFDKLFANLNTRNYKDKEYIFFLPPYSAVYWYAAKKDGYYNELIRFARYMLEKTEKYENVRFVCTYDIDFITEIDNYADMIHYSPVMNEVLTDAMASREYDLTLENFNVRVSKIDSLVTEFERKDGDYFQCN